MGRTREKERKASKTFRKKMGGGKGVSGNRKVIFFQLPFFLGGGGLGGERAVSDRIILFYSRQHLRGVLVHGEEVPNHVIAEVRKGLETFQKYR